MQEEIPRSVHIFRHQEAVSTLFAVAAIIAEVMAGRVAEHRTLARYSKFYFYKIQNKGSPFG